MTLRLKQNGNPYVAKHLNRKEFLKKQRYQPLGGVIVHHRKASLGGIKSGLVHPLANDEATVHVMQNGTKRSLATMFFTDSDTEALASMWDEVSDLALGCILDGTGVLFVMDSGRLYFHRDKGRTLYVCTKGPYKGMYASEPVEEGMWALVDEYDLKELPLNMQEWDLEHGTPEAFTWQECRYYQCGDQYLGRALSYRCPDCNTKVNSYQGYNAQNHKGKGAHK